MKRATFLFSSIFILGLLFTSCNKEEPSDLQPGTNTLDWSLYPNGQNSYPWPTWTLNSQTTKNTLIESFVGHQCASCPDAQDEWVNLANQYGTDVVTLSHHASEDGASQATNATFPSDLTYPEGKSLVSGIQNFLGNPSGMVNRYSSNGEHPWLLPSSWSTEVSSAVANNSTPDFLIQAQYNYYPSTNGLFFHTETECKTTKIGEFYLVNYLIRKEITGAQWMPDNSVNNSYVHKNVVTKAINGLWGNVIAPTGSKAGTRIYNDFTVQLRNPAADPTYSLSNLAIVSVVYNKATNEVEQVIQTDLN